MGRPVLLKQFWKELPLQARQQTLATLSRMVAQTVFGDQKPIARQEVDHDQN